MALLDNRVIDADAPSYQKSLWEAGARKEAEAKKRKYLRACQELRASFTPLICSTDAVLHLEYAEYQRRLASQLANEWDKPYSTVLSWVRIRTQFAIFRAVDVRLRGSRRRLMSLSILDGAGIGIGH